MAADLILKAVAIITMDVSTARADAVAIDTTSGRIAAVGTLEACRQAAPTAAVKDLGDTVLMPGFIDPHSHPLLGGVVTQEPAHWISPHRGYATFADVEALWRKLDAELPPEQPVLCNGLDRLLQGAPELTNVQLDAFFPRRPAVVIDNSGHEVYFNSAVIALNGWAEGKPPADPVGARFGRNPDGTSNGRAYETAAIVAAAMKVMKLAVPHPLLSGARWYALMARGGVTTTTEHTFDSSLLAGYVALAGLPNCPLRLALYHMSIDPTCGEKITTPIPEEMLWKQGIKLWADGSPWVGTIAASFPYLDNATTRRAGIPPGPAGETMLNYPRAQLDVILARHAPQGWQMAFHVNGDVGLDVVLDAYERALATHGLMGKDHRWRLEHCGGARGDQFARAARLGVVASLMPAQFIYWGDLLDGTMFAPEIGSQWMRAGDGDATDVIGKGPCRQPGGDAPRRISGPHAACGVSHRSRSRRGLDRARQVCRFRGTLGRSLHGRHAPTDGARARARDLTRGQADRPRRVSRRGRVDRSEGPHRARAESRREARLFAWRRVLSALIDAPSAVGTGSRPGRSTASKKVRLQGTTAGYDCRVRLQGTTAGYDCRVRPPHRRSSRSRSPVPHGRGRIMLPAAG